ncbi:Cd27-binding protein (siva) protein (macronuclear) [Tetrahymena thermophila SB210]|uniref:Cd27-binding protein (Siva) protein n=1 Tax=Tetrahymena thermophila (strain SB210) TaxID=312017 RepID=I7MJZ0_TETTS|nr:Cd27-binding protein (siva) protein [Tetrahymena thermophila SB210]EAS07671.2 Cd27-binding protein (siva) protein [Tetrahymena thermophila SB210]|eukprot:XP_001027913.2 Cd27-binding protein (siva) protein [Tetrahymena thermophila SB210]
MLRKSPYIQENFEQFFTKEWDRSNSLLNSQESITQALNFMQNLRLDHFENSPAKGCLKDMIEDNISGDISRNFNQSQQMKQSTGAMIDISSQINKSTRMAENMNNTFNNQNNKRSINYSAFDQTSSLLLQGNYDLFAQKKPFVDSNNNIMKQILENDSHTCSSPQFCSYCKLHFDQVLLLKRQQESSNCKENSNFQSKKYEQKNKLDSFFIRKQKNPPQTSQAVHSQQQNFSNMMNQSASNQVQQTLYKFSTNNLGNKEFNLNNIPANNFTLNNNFSIQPIEQNSEKLFQKCNECNRLVCFKCCKQCSKCESIVCPLPLCTTVIYEQYEDVILCSKCVSAS